MVLNSFGKTFKYRAHPGLHYNANFVWTSLAVQAQRVSHAPVGEPHFSLLFWSLRWPRKCLKSVKMGRKAEVEALLPIEQAQRPAKSQAKASLLHFCPGNFTLQLQTLRKGSFS